ncbi:phosphatidate cytidylyltransferase [Kosakonia pseudosacchari]|uniref:phosphatidate cytidylyltransferase n=1 Tax=Kosakonia pseudosacchari TaxID=1646340 RepID=UPI00223F9DB0|nr:phosphatidate cytidylyltransferase [Kosakonia pseudosacchari]
MHLMVPGTFTRVSSGGLCMSAIKRDRGVKDFGAMLEGHGGMMDRIDSLCFAAPIFFHVVRYYFT